MWIRKNAICLHTKTNLQQSFFLLLLIKLKVTRSIVVIRVNFFQTELMVEICSESLVRAIGKILLMKFSKNTN